MQLVFFAASIIVLLGGHAILWLFLVKFLSLTAFNTRLALLAVLLFLFLSSILASYLIHRRDNLFTRWYYIITGFWIGWLLNFALALALIGLMKFSALAFHYTWPHLVLEIIFFGAATLFSLWGVYNATTPRVTEYTIPIKDLPEAWNNKSIVQISDVHLGPVYRQRFFSRLVDQIQDLDPIALFITGDLFDGMESDFSWFDHDLNRLSLEKGIYYSFGNHDLYLGFNRVVELLKDKPLQIMDNKMVVVDGLQIIGINYAFNNDFELDQEILKQVGYDKNKPSLLMFHDPNDIPLAKSAGINLQLSGHTHNGQLIPLNWLEKFYYHGYNYGFFSAGDFNVVISSGTGTWGPPMKTVGHSEIVRIKLIRK